MTKIRSVAVKKERKRARIFRHREQRTRNEGKINRPPTQFLTRHILKHIPAGLALKAQLRLQYSKDPEPAGHLADSSRTKRLIRNDTGKKLAKVSKDYILGTGIAAAAALPRHEAVNS